VLPAGVVDSGRVMDGISYNQTREGKGRWNEESLNA